MDATGCDCVRPRAAGPASVDQFSIGMFTVPRSTIYGHLDKATVGARPRAQKTVPSPSPSRCAPVSTPSVSGCAGMRLRGALDVEHARTAAAEQLAAELGGRVEDLRVALRMLEAGNSGHGPVDMAPFVA